MGFHLPVRSRVTVRRPSTAALRDDAGVFAADWADAALSLALAQARYRSAFDSGSGVTELAAATGELMRARTRLEALRRAAAPGALLPAG